MSAAHKIQPGWYSIEGAAIYTGFTSVSIRNAIAAGHLPKRTVSTTQAQGKAVRIKREWLDAWIDGDHYRAPGETQSITIKVESLTIVSGDNRSPQASSSKSLSVWLSIEGAIKYSGLSKSKIAKEVRNGSFTNTFRGKRLIERESFDAWLRAGIGEERDAPKIRSGGRKKSPFPANRTRGGAA